MNGQINECAEFNIPMDIKYVISETNLSRAVDCTGTENSQQKNKSDNRELIRVIMQTGLN